MNVSHIMCCTLASEGLLWW